MFREIPTYSALFDRAPSQRLSKPLNLAQVSSLIAQANDSADA